MIAFIQICVTSYMLLKLIVYYTGFIAEKYPYKAQNDSMIATFSFSNFSSYFVLSVAFCLFCLT